VKLIFADEAWSDTLYWQRHDQRILRRINQLIAHTNRDPVAGIGERWSACGSQRVWLLLPTPPVGRLPPEVATATITKKSFVSR
jgi:hypothetical protein